MEINNSNRLRLYSRYKSDNEYERYLNVIKNNKFSKALSRFRLSSHQLEIETGRYIGLNREERLCRKCNMRMVEDEYHFLIVCPHYNDLRRKYFTNYYCQWPTIHKFVSLMSSNSEKVISKLSKFIYFAQIKRNEHVSDT